MVCLTIEVKSSEINGIKILILFMKKSIDFFPLSDKFNLGRSFNKVAEICSNIVGFNQKPIYVPDRPQEVKHAVCSSDKARKANRSCAPSDTGSNAS